MAIIVNDRITLPDSELEVRSARSGGPGGQNVNKVESKVQMWWQAEATEALSPTQKALLLSRVQNRLVEGGRLMVSSEKHRDKERNLADCEEKLRDLILASLVQQKTRKKTRPSRGSVERRLKAKRSRSNNLRGRVQHDGSDD